jgi:hypothetical protein
VELYRLPADAAMQRDRPARPPWKGPRTIAEVLAAASAEMDEQDRAEAMGAWPRRPRRRSLLGRLLGRR